MHRLTCLVLAAFLMLVLPARAVPLDPEGLIRADLLGRALAAMEAEGAASDATGRVVVVDYSLRSSDNRLFVVNLKDGSVTGYRVAHGLGSDADHDGFLDRFSDTPGSNASPEGLYELAEPYWGKHGQSVRLDGLSPTNANARDRNIVIHAADYAEPDFLARHGKLGRSNGCIVFSATDLKAFREDVPQGTLIFVGR